MTKTTMDPTELLAKYDQGDLLRSIAEAMLQLIMEADVGHIFRLPANSRGRHTRRRVVDFEGYRRQ